MSETQKKAEKQPPSVEEATTRLAQAEQRFERANRAANAAADEERDAKAGLNKARAALRAAGC